MHYDYGDRMDVDSVGWTESISDSDSSSSEGDEDMGIVCNGYFARGNANVAMLHPKVVEDGHEGGDEGEEEGKEEERGDRESDGEYDGEDDEDDGEYNDGDKGKEDDKVSDDYTLTVATEFHGDYGSLWLFDKDDPIAFYNLMARLLEPGARRENRKFKLRRWFVEVKNNNKWIRQHDNVYEFNTKEAWKDSYNSNIRPTLMEPGLHFRVFLHREDIDQPANEKSNVPFVWVHRAHRQFVGDAKKDKFMWWPNPEIITNEDGNALETYHARSKNFMKEPFRFLFPEAKSKKTRQYCTFKHRLIRKGAKEKLFFPNREASALLPEFQEELRKRLKKGQGSNGLAPVIEMTVDLSELKAGPAAVYNPVLMDPSGERVVPPRLVGEEVLNAPRRQRTARLAPQKPAAPSKRLALAVRAENHIDPRRERLTLSTGGKPVPPTGYKGMFRQTAQTQPPVQRLPTEYSTGAQERSLPYPRQPLLGVRNLEYDIDQDYTIPPPDPIVVEREMRRVEGSLVPIPDRVTSPPKFGSIGGVRYPYTVPRVPTASEYRDLQIELEMLENEVLQKETFCRVCARIFKFMGTEGIKEHYKIHQNLEERCPKCTMPMMGFTTVEKITHIDTHYLFVPCPFEGCYSVLLRSAGLKELVAHYKEHNRAIMARRVPCPRQGCHADLRRMNEHERGEHAMSHQVGVRVNPRANEAAGTGEDRADPKGKKMCIFCDWNFNKGEDEEEIMRHITQKHRDMIQDEPVEERTACQADPGNCPSHAGGGGKSPSTDAEEQRETGKRGAGAGTREPTPWTTPRIPGLTLMRAPSGEAAGKGIDAEGVAEAREAIGAANEASEVAGKVPHGKAGFFEGDGTTKKCQIAQVKCPPHPRPRSSDPESSSDSCSEDSDFSSSEEENDERVGTFIDLGPRGTNFVGSRPSRKMAKRLAAVARKESTPTSATKKPGFGDTFLHCPICFTYVHRMTKDAREKHKEHCNIPDDLPEFNWAQLTVEEGRAKRTEFKTCSGKLEQNCPICFKNVVELPFEERNAHKLSCGGQRLDFVFLEPGDAKERRDQYAAMKKGQAHYKRRYCNVCYAQVHSMGKVRERTHLNKCNGEAVMLDKGTAALCKAAVQNPATSPAPASLEPTDNEDNRSGVPSPPTPKPASTEFTLDYTPPPNSDGKSTLSCRGTTISGTPSAFLQKLKYFAFTTPSEDAVSRFRTWLGVLVFTPVERGQHSRELGAVKAFLQFLREHWMEGGGVAGGEEGDAVMILRVLHRFLVKERARNEEELDGLKLGGVGKGKGKRKRSLDDEEGREDHEGSTGGTDEEEGGAPAAAKKWGKEVGKKRRKRLREAEKVIFERIMGIEEVRVEVEEYGRVRENEFFDDLEKEEDIRDFLE